MAIIYTDIFAKRVELFLPEMLDYIKKKFPGFIGQYKQDLSNLTFNILIEQAFIDFQGNTSIGKKLYENCNFISSISSYNNGEKAIFSEVNYRCDRIIIQQEPAMNAQEFCKPFITLQIKGHLVGMIYDCSILQKWEDHYPNSGW